MKNTLLWLLPAWIVSVGGAFYLGQKGAHDTTEANELTATRSSLPGGAPRSGLKPANASTLSPAASARSRLRAIPGITNPDNAPGSAQIIARINDPVQRAEAMLALISSLGPDQFESVALALREIGMTNGRESGELRMLLVAWAQADPAAAIAYADENTNGRFDRTTILTEWAKEDAEAAIAWAKAKHDDDGANPWMVGIITGLSIADLPQATALMAEMPRSRERGTALRSVVNRLFLQDPEAAKTWATGIEDEAVRSGALALSARTIADRNYPEAAKWVTEIGDINALNQVSESLAEDWYREDPDAARQWVLDLPAQAIDEGAQGLVNRLAREEPVEAAQFLSDLATKNPDVNFDGAIQRLISNARSQDPELATIWVSGLANERIRPGAYRQTLESWIQRDTQAAQLWMEENKATLPESIRRRFALSDNDN